MEAPVQVSCRRTAPATPSARRPSCCGRRRPHARRREGAGGGNS